MANLVVRNLVQHIVDALKQRAVKYGRSMEAEHRALLQELLLQYPKTKGFAEAWPTCLTWGGMTISSG